jgi:restriction endonuclease S subunit
MNGYTIQSEKLNKNRVFILQKSELEKRLDPFYYVPELVELEKKVLTKQPKKLRDYVKGIASGATPKTTESEKYYAEKENGIPFLRVQNLSPTGILEFDDCKYINEETHNGMLKRSQVSAGDLLVKITGVGRMAVASVAPEGFEGNINQHVCVIKTGCKEISEQLAAFLNTDIGEKLASRRSTGGTRPALDYPALLSIPILNDSRILAITQKVVEQKKQNEAAAEKLLSSIDDYLLGELGIKLPEPPENTLKNRIFITRVNDLTGNRYDPFYHQTYFNELLLSLENSKYPKSKLGLHISEITYGASFNNNYVESGVPLLRIKDLKRNEISVDEVVYLPESARNLLGNCFVNESDFLISRSGSIGIVAIVPKSIQGFAFGSFMIKFSLAENSGIIREFLSYYLNSSLMIKLVERNKIGAIQGNITIPTIKNFPLVLPNPNEQERIAAHITNIRHQAQQLKDKTNEALKQVSEEIEQILLG